MKDNLTRTWRKRIAAYDAGQPIPKAHVYALRGALARSNASYKPVSDDMKAELEKLFNRGFAWQITPEQTEQGLAWLKQKKVQKEMIESQRAIVDDFSHFLFVDLFEVSRGHSFSDYLPVYRVCSATGPWFDYISRPWVSGHLFEVL